MEHAEQDSVTGWLDLRDRRFPLESADVTYHRRDGLWSVEIQAVQREFAGERWSPYLYHQGLSLSASSPEQLSGESTSWKALRGPDYPHPELGLLCVFGHHDVYDCTLSFGPLVGAQIGVVWNGLCEVFWDDEFADDVPFRCDCKALVEVR